MVEIDFNRIVDNAKDTLEVGRLMLMSEQKRQDYFKSKRDATELRFYEEGGPHNSNRQLYMMKMITTPLIRENAIPDLQRLTVKGDGYQPDVDTPLVFKPNGSDSASLYYKSHEMFKLTFRDADGNTYEPSGLKSFEIASDDAPKKLALVSNEEWNGVVEKVVPNILADKDRPEMDVMMEKAGTDYIERLNLVLDYRAKGHVLPSEMESRPSVREQVNNMSDAELQRMFEAAMSNVTSKTNDGYNLER